MSRKKRKTSYKLLVSFVDCTDRQAVADFIIATINARLITDRNPTAKEMLDGLQPDSWFVQKYRGRENALGAQISKILIPVFGRVQVRKPKKLTPEEKLRKQLRTERREKRKLTARCTDLAEQLNAMREQPSGFSPSQR